MSSLIQIQPAAPASAPSESSAVSPFWRTLEERAGTQQNLGDDDEFPDREPDWQDNSKRRDFLKLMGASLALAGVSACTKQPHEAIVPYVREPEQLVPGKPLFYATAMPVPGGAIGVLAESHMGRPTKIEGNPNHPASLGATDIFTQASILEMWNPDRAQTATRNGQISSWINFVAVLAGLRDEHSTRQGAGLAILTRPFTSPTLASQMQAFLAAMPQAKLYQWEPLVRTPGQNPVYNLAAADIIVSLDADFLCGGANNVRYSYDFAQKRRVMEAQSPAEQTHARQQGPDEVRPEGPGANQTAPAQSVPGQRTMNRLYVAEGTPSLTGGAADHRIRIRTSELPAFAAELARQLGVAGAASSSGLPENATRVIPAIVRDLQAHKGASLVIAGEYQPAAVHALARQINDALGNTGKTVTYSAPVDFNPVDNVASIRDLVNAMNGGQVQTLIIMGGNPVYDAPADLQFGQAIRKVKLRAMLSPYFNETAALCQWHIPQTHYLETWGDVRSQDGTATVQQPLIAPLYNGISPLQVMSVLTNKADANPHDIVKTYWSTRAGGGDFNAWWQRTLHDGVVPANAPANAAASAVAAAAPTAGTLPSVPHGTLEIVFRPDPTIGDGEWAHNSWLQETPKPQNKMTWDNAAWVSPTTASRLGLSNGDVVELSYKDRKLNAPVWVMPGHADDSVTVHFGYGRTRGGSIGTKIGFNAYALRTSDAPWVGGGLTVRKTGSSYPFATRQHQDTMAGREPVKVMALGEYHQAPEVEVEHIPRELTLYPEYSYAGYKWGMSIDLNACTGCQACMVACQAENNIPVVGKDQVDRGRHMNWIRVDRYYRGKAEDPEVYYQPVPCMHCETAPCEPVCPVAATVHSGDGLNQMVYNRCVGTRYCSNNCPYKVRRFNFYLYSDWYKESLHGLRNPDVTVRSRGVMEKCTYCVQRINAAKIESEKEDRRIVDGEILTACQQVCPTRAITFGDINDPNSRVAKLKAQPRNYSLLEDLNTRPRTTYLARLRNPNPEIEKG